MESRTGIELAEPFEKRLGMKIDATRNPEVFKQVLLPLEFWCLKLAIRQQEPQTTRQFYTSKVRETFKEAWFAPLFRYRSEFENIFPDLSLWASLEYAADKAMTPVHPKSALFKRLERSKESQKFVNLYLSNHTSETKVVDDMTKALRAVHVDFPSYETILDVLNTLASWRFLIRREVEGKNALAYWFLNPVFSVKYKHIFNDILKL